MTSDEEIHPEALARRLRAGEPVAILDVRNRDEYETWRVEGRTVTDAQVPHAKFIAANAKGDPVDLVPDELADTADPIVVVCPRGKASGEVAGTLRGSGLDAVNLAGGMTAWARTSLAVELDAGDATVVQYQRPSSGCLAHLVVSGGEAALLDPLRAFAERYEHDLRQRNAELRDAVDTHVHADHVSGGRRVVDRTNADVVLPAGAADRGLAFDARLVDDGEELQVGDVTLEAVHAPGHTSELTAFRLRDGGETDVLFTGDALFLRSVGRPDLERGDEAAREYAGREYESLHDRLLTLPDETLVAPGHFADHADAVEDAYAAPLGDLRGMDVLALDREAFVERVASNLPPRPSNYERIIATNLGRESMDDDDAFEAELGPNNCAVS